MTEKEKENRIHSLALSFLERQQIIPNLYAGQIIRGYKEGYHQAEKDFKMKEVDLEKEIKNSIDSLSNLYCYMEDLFNGNEEEGVYPIPENVKNELFEFARHFFELGIKAQKGE